MSDPVESTVVTTNDAVVMMGANLPNHTKSAQGLSKWVRLGSNTPTVFRTRQEAWRAVAWILALVEKRDLPEERTLETERTGPDELFDILTAVFQEANVDIAPLMLALTTAMEDLEEELES